MATERTKQKLADTLGRGLSYTNRHFVANFLESASRGDIEGLVAKLRAALLSEKDHAEQCSDCKLVSS